MHCYIYGLGFCAFARHYSRNHFCFLLLWVMRCFSSPRSPSTFVEWHSFTVPGCPIRISRDLWLFAPTPCFSQLITSFFASQSLGIHRSLLFCFFFFIVSHTFLYAYGSLFCFLLLYFSSFFNMSKIFFFLTSLFNGVRWGCLSLVSQEVYIFMPYPYLQRFIITMIPVYSLSEFIK